MKIMIDHEMMNRILNKDSSKKTFQEYLNIALNSDAFIAIFEDSDDLIGLVFRNKNSKKQYKILAKDGINFSDYQGELTYIEEFRKNAGRNKNLCILDIEKNIVSDKMERKQLIDYFFTSGQFVPVDVKK